MTSLEAVEETRIEMNANMQLAELNPNIRLDWQKTRDTCREFQAGVASVELRNKFDDLNNQINSKLRIYVASARKAKTDFDAMLPLLDQMQAMLSQRGRLRKLMDTAGLPSWTAWFADFGNRMEEEVTIRTIQRKLRLYRGIPDADDSAEKIQPGSRDDTTRPIWMGQDVRLTYNATHRRMEAEAEYIVWQKQVGKKGNPRTDRVLSRITVWEAVYAGKGKADKAALRKAVLAKVIAAAEDTEYFDVAVLNKKADELKA
jgi:hypothetical protein